MAIIFAQIMEIGLLEKEVLSKLIFEESFDNIMAECKSLAIPNVVADVLKQLIQHKLVVARYTSEIEIEPRKAKSGFMYDSDRMKDYSYKITSKGIKALMENGRNI